MLRAEAPGHRCLDCEQHIATHAGPVVPGGYHYLSRVIAGALADVARGSTYASASTAARAELAHELLARRVQSLRNGPRTRSLLKLITAGIVNEVNRDEWAARIYDHLEVNDRRPARLQRAVAGVGLVGP